MSQPGQESIPQLPANATPEQRSNYARAMAARGITGNQLPPPRAVITKGPNSDATLALQEQIRKQVGGQTGAGVQGGLDLAGQMTGMGLTDYRPGIQYMLNQRKTMAEGTNPFYQQMKQQMNSQSKAGLAAAAQSGIRGGSLANMRRVQDRQNVRDISNAENQYKMGALDAYGKNLGGMMGWQMDQGYKYGQLASPKDNPTPPNSSGGGLLSGLFSGIGL